MKVGIVTIYDFFNHGNRLQNYALEQTLIKMGHDVTTFAITPKKVYSYVLPIASCLPFIPVVSRMNKSKKHTKKYFHNVIINRYSKKKLKQLGDEFDAFIIGSDQVWNPKYMANKFVSFLKFAEKDKCIAYAPSFGIEVLPEKLKKEFADGLSHIKYLSVRENEGKKILENQFGFQNVPLVVDPTFLLDKADWQKFSTEVKDKPKEHIVTYFLAPKKEYKQKVKQISKKFNLPVINLNNSFDKFFKTNPSEFIDLLLGAKLVCTNSFHGHAMSIILEKPFVSFLSFKSTKSRIHTLLKMTDLENRNWQTLEEKDYFVLDYSKVREKIEQEREKSLAFLSEALTNVEKCGGGTKMIAITDKTKCCGCHACANICPKNCIEMVYDDEGFLYPKIDKSKCINCGLCKNICPILNKPKVEEKVFPCAYAAYNKDLAVRMQSSSGGLFSLLADFVLSENGVVFGAAFNDKFEVEHIGIENAEDLNKLRISKYVQSRIGNSYKDAKKFLDNGRKVLFTGTPCQIAGLLKFLGRPYENLYTQDIICHGVPSPGIWQKYVEYRAKCEGDDVSVKEIKFRKKINSWKKYSFSFVFSNDKEYRKTPYYTDPMMKMFLFNKCLRPSCHKCAFKDVNRPSDITLADFWGVNGVARDLNDDKGISLVLVHSEKGKELFEKIKDKIVFREVDFKKATRHNPLVKRSARKSPSRNKVMKDFKKLPFEKVVKRHGSGIL